MLRIAHLSDLHFGATSEDRRVWPLVCDFINQQVRPHMILVTGDITDSAAVEEFRLAAESLNGLVTQQPGGDAFAYRIVAGNHDRFQRGAKGRSAKAPGARPQRAPADSAARFHHAFPGAVQLTLKAQRVDLYDAAARWKVCLIGLDSSADAQRFAQGSVTKESIAAVRREAAAAVDADLVIVLVHHHVLPVPAVEQRLLHDPARLLAATGMLNAGSLMAALSAAQVDLVLHGHQHASHQARFSGADEFAGNVAVLAAGSATGAGRESGANGRWELGRVHFNVIELHGDRRVWLRQVDGSSGELAYRPGERLLLRAEDIRASRFVRRHRGTAAAQPAAPLPQSRLRKVVEFRPNRDIDITESLSNWAVNDSFTHVTANGSGILSDAEIVFDWKAGGVGDGYSVKSVKDKSDPHRRAFALDVGGGGQKRLANRITTSFRWVGGAVLTRAECASLPDTALAGPRRDAEEFASVLARGEFEELSMTVRLPLRFAPDPARVRVYYEEPGHPPEFSTELERGLGVCGRGHIELRVPYPLPGYRYGLRWPLIDEDTRPAPARELEGALIGARVQAASLIESAIRRQGWSGSVRWNLYVPSPQRADYRLLPVFPNAPGAQQMMLRDARGLARTLYWGETVVAVDGDGASNRSERLPDECVLGLVPVRWSGDPLHEALCLLRVAFVSDPMGGAPAHVWRDEFRAFAAALSPALAAFAGRALNYSIASGIPRKTP